VQYQDRDASAIFKEDLREDSPWLNDAEFKDKYHMTHSSFWLIVDLIFIDHPIFQSMKRKQAPAEHQLMTILCFVGMEGNGMSDWKGRSVFHAGKGALQVYKNRVVKAILDCLYKDFVKWPDPDELQVIVDQIRADFGLPNCVGIADGTLLFLVFCPSTDNYVNYKGRNMLYALRMLVINDDKR
jgi:hypothetical protein